MTAGDAIVGRDFTHDCELVSGVPFEGVGLEAEQRRKREEQAPRPEISMITQVIFLE